MCIVWFIQEYEPSFDENQTQDQNLLQIVKYQEEKSSHCVFLLKNFVV